MWEGIAGRRLPEEAVTESHFLCSTSMSPSNSFPSKENGNKGSQLTFQIYGPAFRKNKFSWIELS